MIIRSEEITEVLRRCGGYVAVMLATQDGAYPIPITDRSTVHKWPQIGVPERHWALIIRLSGGEVTAATLHAMNERLRHRQYAAREQQPEVSAA